MSETPQETAAKNFLQSGAYDFNGRELQPFTPERQAVATEMGMKWPYITKEDAVTMKVLVPLSEEEIAALPKKKRAQKDQTKEVDFEHYRQSFKDSLIAMWLCSQPVSRVKRAGRKPEEALDEMWTWAEKHGYSQGSDIAGEGLMVWVIIAKQIRESKSVPKDKETGAPPEEQDAGEL